MLLRAAAVGDLPNLVDVQEAGAQAGLANIFPQDVYPFPRDDLRARWASEITNPAIDVYVVTRRADLIEGFAAIRGDEVLHFGTAVQTWGSGLAAAVHGELTERLTRAGHATARLRVFEENRRARRFTRRWAGIRLSG